MYSTFIFLATFCLKTSKKRSKIWFVSILNENKIQQGMIGTTRMKAGHRVIRVSYCRQEDDLLYALSKHRAP